MQKTLQTAILSAMLFYPTTGLAQEHTLPQAKFQSAALTQQTGVRVNGQPVSPQKLKRFEQQYQLKVQRGAYWYDARSGLWGLQGGPALGVMKPGLKLGPALKANASGGGNGRLTGTFVNGRELHPMDVARLRAAFGVVYTGRFWLDGQGNLGRQGGPKLVNLWRSGRTGFHRGRYTDTGSGSSGGSGYVMGKDWSVSW